MTEPPGELVGLDDLAEYEGADELSETDLAVAIEQVRGYCDWHIAPPVTREVLLSGRGPDEPRLVLPTLRLIELVSVVDLEHDDAPVTGWREIGTMLYRRGGWPRGDHNLRVTLRDGYDTPPADLCSALVALGQAVGDAPAGVRSETETVGQRTNSRTYFVESIRRGSSGYGPALTAILDRYSVRW